MSKLNFSKGKFSRFVSSKGFYAAVALCLVGAGAATWLAVERSLSDNGLANLAVPENAVFDDYPLAEEVEKKDETIPKESPVGEASAAPTTPRQSASSVSAPQQDVPEQPSEPAAQSEELPVAANLPALAYTLPVSGNVINPYSNGELVKSLTLGDWRTHDGMDIAADRGVDVLAAADGVVSEVKNDPLWGTVITIDHPDGCQSIYSGLNSAVPVSTGDRVIGKQAIGKVDSVPCEISDESHMHFAMKREGKWVDPTEVIK